MGLIKRDRVSVRDESASGFNVAPLTVQPHDKVSAWRINGDYTVSACVLVACAHGLPVKWFKRERGCDVTIDRPSGDYFSNESDAYRTAHVRAHRLQVKALAALHKADARLLDTANALRAYWHRHETKE